MEDDTEQNNSEGAAKKDGTDGEGRKRVRKKQVQEGRNRASPARLVKLNKGLDQAQKDLIEIEYFLGGLLKIEATTMPVDLNRWVLQCYNPNSESIVVPCKGEIPVTAESVHQTLGLRNSEEEVFYGWDAEAISFVNNRYGFENGSAPEITTFCKMIEDMNGRADDDFMRAWLIVGVSTFMCPTTTLHVSPRCYPIVADLEKVKRLNFCSFIAKQIRSSLGDKRKKKAVNCFVHHLVVLYVDSLLVDFEAPTCLVLVEAWDSKLIAKVAKADRKTEGGYNKLRKWGNQLKPSFASNSVDGLFAGIEQTEEFVSSKLPPTFNRVRKRKIAVMISKLCSVISDAFGSFIEDIGQLDKDDAATSNLNITKRSRAQGPSTNVRESENDGGTPGEETEYSQSSGPGDGRATASTDNSSEAFVNPQQENRKHNILTQKNVATMKIGNATTNEVTASVAEPGKECANLGPDGGHNKTTTHLHLANNEKSEQDNSITNTHGPRKNGDITSAFGNNHITIHDISPISSAPPIKHHSANEAAQQKACPEDDTPHTDASNHEQTTFLSSMSATPSSTNMSLQCGKHGDNCTAATKKLCPAPSSCKPQATQTAMDRIREKLRLGHLAQQQVIQREKTAATPLNSTPTNYNNNQAAGTNGCPSFDLNLSFHGDESIKRNTPTTMEPQNLDAYMAEGEDDDWGLDLEELQEVCYKEEAYFAKQKQKEMEERVAKQSCSNNQDSKTPAKTTVPAADFASSSKTPAVAGHERRVVRAPAQLRSPYVDPKNADPFYCSKEVCDIYDAVCQFSGPQMVTRRRATRSDNSKPIINYDEFFINCNELANSMAPEKKIDNIVAEIAITSMKGSDPRPKRRIMPLRIAYVDPDILPEQ